MVGPAGVLKGGGDPVDGAAPGLMVSSTCRSLVVVNPADTEGPLDGVFKMFLWSLSITVASGEYTIQGYLVQAMVTPPFGRHALPIVAVTSATWPLCW